MLHWGHGRRPPRVRVRQASCLHWKDVRLDHRAEAQEMLQGFTQRCPQTPHASKPGADAGPPLEFFLPRPSSNYGLVQNMLLPLEKYMDRKKEIRIKYVWQFSTLHKLDQRE